MFPPSAQRYCAPGVAPRPPSQASRRTPTSATAYPFYPSYMAQDSPAILTSPLLQSPSADPRPVQTEATTHHEAAFTPPPRQRTPAISPTAKVAQIQGPGITDVRRSLAVHQACGGMMPPSSQMTHLSYSSPPSSQHQPPLMPRLPSSQGIRRRRDTSVNRGTAGGKAAELMLAEMEDRRPWGDKLMDAHEESMGSIQKIQETCASLSSDGKTVRDQVYGLLGVVKALPTKDDIMEDINTSIPALLESGWHPIIEKIEANARLYESKHAQLLDAQTLRSHLDLLRQQVKVDTQVLVSSCLANHSDTNVADQPMIGLMNHLISSLEPLKAIKESTAIIKNMQEILPAIQLLPQALFDISVYHNKVDQLSKQMTTSLDAMTNVKHIGSGLPTPSRTPERDDPPHQSVTAPPVIPEPTTVRRGVRFSAFDDSPSLDALVELNPCPLSPTLHPSLRSPLELPTTMTHRLPDFLPLPAPRLARATGVQVDTSEAVTARLDTLCKDVSQLQETMSGIEKYLSEPPAPSWVRGIESKLDVLTKGMRDLKEKSVPVLQQDQHRTPSGLTHLLTAYTPISNPPKEVAVDVPSLPVNNTSGRFADVINIPPCQATNPTPVAQADHIDHLPSQDVFGPVQSIATLPSPAVGACTESSFETHTTIGERAKSSKRPAAKRKTTEESASTTSKKRRSASEVQKSTPVEFNIPRNVSTPCISHTTGQGMMTRSRSRSSGSQVDVQQDNGGAPQSGSDTHSASDTPAKRMPKRSHKKKIIKPADKIVQLVNTGVGIETSEARPLEIGNRDSTTALSQTQHDPDSQHPDVLPPPAQVKSKEQVTGITTSESSSDSSRASDFEATERKRRIATAKKKKSRGRRGPAGVEGRAKKVPQQEPQADDHADGSTLGGANRNLGTQPGLAGEQLKGLQRIMSIAARSLTSTAAPLSAPASDFTFSSPFLPLTSNGPRATTVHDPPICPTRAAQVNTRSAARISYGGLTRPASNHGHASLTESQHSSQLRAIASTTLTFDNNRKLTGTQSRTLESQNSATGQQQRTQRPSQTAETDQPTHLSWTSGLGSQSVGFPTGNMRGGLDGGRAVTYGGRRMDERRLIPITMDSDDSD